MAAILGFNGSQAGVKQLSPWDDDDVQTRARLVPTENLPDQPLGPVPVDSATELSGRCDSQAPDGQPAAQDEERRVPPWRRVPRSYTC